ncbi:hypothetical protein MtrunA17_Chr8g0342701 [Medicago truncatula]|uniref:Transmembrane protein n=1 Tax=Medicago truncatula TaxID=3880 RepID=A0A396GKZ8_MEDTR|nr:hypothetical protein MtrunA17_Chr8g0342701 [Medicago truncatula]
MLSGYTLLLECRFLVCYGILCVIGLASLKLISLLHQINSFSLVI